MIAGFVLLIDVRCQCCVDAFFTSGHLTSAGSSMSVSLIPGGCNSLNIYLVMRDVNRAVAGDPASPPRMDLAPMLRFRSEFDTHVRPREPGMGNSPPRL